MFQQSEDYIIRVLIPMFVTMLAQVLGLKMLNRYEEASELIESTAEKILGMKIDLILRVPDQYLMAMLRDDTLEGRVKCLILAEVLKETAEIYQGQEKTEESYACYLKSFNIFFEMLLIKESRGLQHLFSPEELTDRFTSFAQVVEVLRGFQLSEEVMFKVMSYYEHTGAFADAEDILFEALEISTAEESALEKGIDRKSVV